MIAVDTNVLARLLLRDDEIQYQAARDLFRDGRDYTAPITVILELVWVLRVAGIDRYDIGKSLRELIELPNFKPALKTEIIFAIELYAKGLDFADALHLALSNGNEALLTFDERFAARAGHLETKPPVQAMV
jgi:predicted nucleic-acid-binding protein